jgi:hypothetical protein
MHRRVVPRQLCTGGLVMSKSLEVRRLKVVRQLARVNRKIAATEKRLVQIQDRMTVLGQGGPKAA